MALKKRIFLITVLLYILYTIFPLFADVIRIPVWLPSIAASAIMLGLYPKALANKSFYWFIAYAAVLVLYFLSGRPITIGIGSVADSRKIFIEFSYLLPTISIFSVLFYLKDELLMRKIIIWSMGILYISFVFEWPLMQKYSSLREAYQEEVHEKVLSIPGLPGYSLMHAYTLFLPVICFLFKKLKKTKRIIVLIGLFVLCFVIYDTFVTTSLILMISILIFTFFYSDKSNSTLIITYGILAVMLLFLYENGFFISFIDWIMPAFEGTPVQEKLIDFKNSMMLGLITGDSITGRLDYHLISQESFIANPIWGTSVVGGHSTLLDRFGGMGIVGGLPFIMIIITHIRQMVGHYKTRMAKSFYWVGIIIGFVFLYNKGNWGCESWLFFLVLTPIGLLTFERETR